MQKKINFNITDGDTFFTDEVAVIHNPVRIFLDFKQTSPRVDVRFNDHQPMVMKHNVVMMDPITAKELYRVLGDNLKQYEEKFGAIEKTEAVKRAEKMAAERKEAQSTVTTSDKPNYFG